MMRGKASAADAELSPSIVALVGFAVPLLGIGLASPLLGLVDTAVVGRCTGSLQLAALAPSVALSDITFYLFRGMGATTTAFVAAAEADGDAARAARAVHTSVVLAALIGVSIGMLLYVGCLPLLRRLSGAASAEILAEARGYVRVRALGMPAGMVFMVLQASFLGGRDWRPPPRRRWSRASPTYWRTSYSSPSCAGEWLARPGALWARSTAPQLLSRTRTRAAAVPARLLLPPPPLPPPPRPQRSPSRSYRAGASWQRGPASACH